MVYRFLTIVRRNLVLVETCQWMGRPIVSSLLVFVVNVFFVFMSQSKSANKRSLVETDFRSGMRNERWTKRLVNTFSTCVCDVIVTWPAQSSNSVEALQPLNSIVATPAALWKLRTWPCQLRWPAHALPLQDVETEMERSMGPNKLSLIEPVLYLVFACMALAPHHARLSPCTARM